MHQRPWKDLMFIIKQDMAEGAYLLNEMILLNKNSDI